MRVLEQLRRRYRCSRAGSPGSGNGAVCVRLCVGLLLAAWTFAADAAWAELHLGQRFPSRALGRDLAYSIYLPPGYAVEASERYPVLYLLHGVGGDERTWPKAGGVQTTADDLIGRGVIPPLVIVMPDAGSSWFVDSQAIGGPGNFATAIGFDLPAHIEASWRVRPGPSARAVAGQSMGGFGALRLAFAEPDRYCAVAALSPVLWSRLPVDRELTRNQVALLSGAFGSPPDIARLHRQSPLGLIPTLAAGSSRPAIYLMSGDRDEFGAAADVRALRRELRLAGIPVTSEIVPGTHTWSLWAGRLDMALRFLSEALQECRSNGR
jgi:enterochelin esterase family protein